MNQSTLRSTLDRLDSNIAVLESGVNFSLGTRKHNRNAVYYQEKHPEHIYTHQIRNTNYFVNNFTVTAAYPLERTRQLLNAIDSVISCLFNNDDNWRNKTGKLILRNFNLIDVDRLRTGIENRRLAHTVKVDLKTIIRNILNGNVANYL